MSFTYEHIQFSHVIARKTRLINLKYTLRKLTYDCRDATSRFRWRSTRWRWIIFFLRTNAVLYVCEPTVFQSQLPIPSRLPQGRGGHRQDADRRSYPHCPSRLTHPDSHLRDPYFPLVNANQPIAHSRCKVTMLVLNPRILCQVSMPVVDPSVGALNA